MENEQLNGDEKYEVRFWNDKGMYVSVKTNSWFAFMKLRFTKKVIYYKVLFV